MDKKIREAINAIGFEIGILKWVMDLAPKGRKHPKLKEDYERADKRIARLQFACDLIRQQDKSDKEVREYLWLHHGCGVHPLYGDDGEMQCSKCVIDFKRQPLIELVKVLYNRTRRM